MQLTFRPIREHNGRTIEAADVTDHRDFWKAWRTSTAEERDRYALGQKDGRWLLYRAVEPETGHFERLSTSYVLRDTSRLLPYQPRAVAGLCGALTHSPVALDASDTGIGKTFQDLAVARDLGLRPAVVTRIAAIPAYIRASQQIGTRRPLFVTNWEKLKLGKTEYVLKTGRDYRWRIPPRTLLIFDEAHMGNNFPSSLNSRMMAAAFKSGTPCIAASATLAERPDRMMIFVVGTGLMTSKQFEEWLDKRGRLVTRVRVGSTPKVTEELLAELHRLAGQENYAGIARLLGVTVSYRDVKRFHRFTLGDLKSYLMERQPVTEKVESLSDAQDMAELGRMLIPAYGVRVSQDDPDVAKNFPEGVYRVLLLNIGDRKEEEHNQLYTALMERVEQITREMDESQARVAAIAERMKYRRATELLKAPMLLDEAVNYINQGKSVVIFVSFRDTLKWLAAKSGTPCTIYGGQNAEQREQSVEMFQADRCRLCISTVGAGGVALSLHDTRGNYPRVSILAPVDKATEMSQCMGRVRRAGSQSVPVMFLAYAAGTIEEQVAQRVESRMMSIRSLNERELVEHPIFAGQDDPHSVD